MIKEFLTKKNVLALLGLLLVAVALPVAAILVQQSQETRKEASVCDQTARSYISFTNAAGGNTTSARINDVVQAHVYLTGNIHAADIVLRYKPALLEVTNAGAGTSYPNPDTDGWARWLLTIKKAPGASYAVSGEVAVVTFRVNTAQATLAEIVYGSNTTIAYNGVAGGAECGTKGTLALNASFNAVIRSVRPAPPNCVLRNSSNLQDRLLEITGDNLLVPNHHLQFRKVDMYQTSIQYGQEVDWLSDNRVTLDMGRIGYWPQFYWPLEGKLTLVVRLTSMEGTGYLPASDWSPEFIVADDAVACDVTITPTVTPSPRPTNTPIPTSTPAPTNTPRPTATPTVPAPTPTLAAQERCRLTVVGGTNHALGETVRIQLLQIPKFLEDGNCYSGLLTVNVSPGGQTINVSGFSRDARTQEFSWPTAGKPAGTYTFQSFYGGHNDNGNNVIPTGSQCNPDLACCDNAYTCSTQVVLTAAATPTPTPTTGACAKLTFPDATGDSQVDMVDFARWKDEFTEVLATKTADFNCDTRVDMADFVIWKDYYLAH